MLIQQRLDGGCYFNRSWEECKQGFGNFTGHYWMGNERLYQLNKNARCSVRYDLTATNNTFYQVTYSSFSISDEATNYSLNVGGLLSAWLYCSDFRAHPRLSPPSTHGPATVTRKYRRSISLGVRKS